MDMIFRQKAKINWALIKKQRRKQAEANNKKENHGRREHSYKVDDQVMVKEDPSRKLEGERFSGPYTVTQVFDNGTVQLSKASNRGAVLTTWNIRQLKPC